MNEDKNGQAQPTEEQLDVTQTGAVPAVVPEIPAAVVESVAAPAPAPTQSSASAGITPEQMEQILKRVVPSQQAPDKAGPPMSQEEFDQKFRVARVQKEMVETIRSGDVEPAMRSLQEFGHAIVRQALTMSHYQQQVLREEMQREYQPALSYAQEQKLNQLKSEFFTDHADLKDFEPITKAVVDQMKAEGYNSDGKISKQMAFAEVAKRTKEIISKLPGVQKPVASASSSSRMSTLTSGGQGAGGAKPSSGVPKSAGMAVFDE